MTCTQLYTVKIDDKHLNLDLSVCPRLSQLQVSLRLDLASRWQLKRQLPWEFGMSYVMHMMN
jgi:hypothetical protein